MKLILTGATGFIGSEVLRQSLNDTSIESVLVLSRRQIDTSHPKLRTVIVEDFANLSPEALDKCAGADACIWTLGSVDTKNSEAARKVNLDYTLSAAKAFVNLASAGHPFKLLYTSGVLAVKEQDSSLWFLREFRKMRGDVENQLLALAKDNPASIEVQIARPGFVIKSDTSYVVELAWKMVPYIKLNVLAAAMLDATADGKANRILENSALLKIGKKAQG